MGLFPGGLAVKIDTAAIAAEMRPALYAWFNAHILIIDPKTSAPTDGPFDPVEDTGGSFVPTTVWDSGVDGALIQPIRGSELANFGDQNVGIQGIRIQAKMTDASIVLHSGLQIIVLDPGEDPNLARFVYAVKEGTESSFAWGRIFDTTVVQSTLISIPTPPAGPGYGNAYGEVYGQ